jgi:hypothetical protein
MNDINKKQPSIEDLESISTIWDLYEDVFSQTQFPSGLNIDLDEVLLTAKNKLDESKKSVGYTVKNEFCNFVGDSVSGIGWKKMKILNHDYNCYRIWHSSVDAISYLMRSDDNFFNQLNSFKKNLYLTSFSGLGEGNKHKEYLRSALQDALRLFLRAYELKNGIICIDK